MTVIKSDIEIKCAIEEAVVFLPCFRGVSHVHLSGNGGAFQEESVCCLVQKGVWVVDFHVFRAGVPTEPICLINIEVYKLVCF